MRTILLLAALAATLAVASAGPVNLNAGCFPTDSKPSFPIKGFSFVDNVKRNFVDMAYIQARKRGRDVAATYLPADCVYIGHKPVHACYNSVIPGALGAPQIGGQYGFEFHANFKCATGRVAVPCKARINTLRTNRPLAVPGRPGKPSFWDVPVVVCTLA